jgi:hypothetical protein
MIPTPTPFRKSFYHIQIVERCRANLLLKVRKRIRQCKAVIIRSVIRDHASPVEKPLFALNPFSDIDAVVHHPQ